MDSGVTAWLDWETERIVARGSHRRVTVSGALASLDRRVAEWVLADTLGVAVHRVLVTLADLSVVLPSAAIEEPETYRALIDEAVAHSCRISRLA